jgi:hypothetical protein
VRSGAAARNDLPCRAGGGRLETEFGYPPTPWSVRRPGLPALSFRNAESPGRSRRSRPVRRVSGPNASPASLRMQSGVHLRGRVETRPAF